ncbi:MAG: cardiolipin synthase [Chitinophagaceae bacterium]|nr:cardiolipin synthase [Chitinophagaceae bacterium]
MDNILEFVKQSQIWVALYFIVSIGVVITILLENRNPSKSLAYILVLLFLPVVGLIVYYFFGRDLRKEKIFKKKVFKETHIVTEFIHKYFSDSERELARMEKEIGDLISPFKLLLSQKQSLVHRNNRVTLLTNGEEKFPALFDALDQARHHIHLEYYIFTKDDIGNQLAEILIRKASEGIKVRVIIDDRGSNHIKDIPRKLKEAGIEVYQFMPVRFASLSQANYRNHRKIVVIDGKTGFVGGINIDDRYINNGKHQLFWRDTHVKIEGSAVKELQFNFFKSLSFVTQKQYELESAYFPEAIDYDDGATISVAASGPASPHPYNLEVLLSAINQAKKSIRIANPYFIPPAELLTALELAAASGIEVELIIPAQSDSYIVQHASFSYLKTLIRRGIKVYLYHKGFMHAKTVVIDGKLSFVGTVNMDIRSFYINFEIAAIVHQPEFASRMEYQFALDKADSSLIRAKEWVTRSRSKKFIDSVCRLLAPLL